MANENKTDMREDWAVRSVSDNSRRIALKLLLQKMYDNAVDIAASSEITMEMEAADKEDLRHEDDAETEKALHSAFHVATRSISPIPDEEILHEVLQAFAHSYEAWLSADYDAAINWAIRKRLVDESGLTATGQHVYTGEVDDDDDC